MLQPLMNDTKWEELRLAMYDVRPAPRFVQVTTAGQSYGPDREWFYHFREPPYRELLRVEIYADDAAHRLEIRPKLEAIHLPGKETSGGFVSVGDCEPGDVGDVIASQ